MGLHLSLSRSVPPPHQGDFEMSRRANRSSGANWVEKAMRAMPEWLGGGLLPNPNFSIFSPPLQTCAILLPIAHAEPSHDE